MPDTQEQVADVVEAAAEAVSEQAETAGEVVGEFVRNLNGIKIKFGLLGAAAGGAVGALIGFRIAYAKLETKFEEMARMEIEDMRVHFYQKELARDEQQAAKDVVEVAEELGYKAAASRVPGVGSGTIRYDKINEEAPAIIDVPGDGTQVVDEGRVNVFPEGGRVSWDMDREMASRTPDHPYVIHKEEFAESENEKPTLTYYEEDDVLADAADKRVEDPDAVVGLENLTRFGHGSGDQNVVYVRNDRLEVDFEILRSPGSFTVEVLGVTAGPEDEGELRHSEDMRRRQPRFDDA